ncbi:hypothetical protein CLOSS21_02683 [Clostridium sp. SS2/1]|nr:hypothetical protein CLOSS21_02683 [Clostridium sp. SS2/1]
MIWVVYFMFSWISGEMFPFSLWVLVWKWSMGFFPLFFFG